MNLIPSPKMQFAISWSLAREGRTSLGIYRTITKMIELHAEAIGKAKEPLQSQLGDMMINEIIKQAFRNDSTQSPQN